ncbi:hypothetical protein KDW_61350 [Dictyobacter vulcani]|uniref:Uncharacterized protein n=1 Tax=Dictyobacter vulcani TaxID=2607529 RepID=A0A5J4KWW5_9CHLR|nr:hypothetical protein [Dictyobacter vulcani]GER91973.1 hypothetical protein KDW_61350 [Dictyobacter vulcani]
MAIDEKERLRRWRLILGKQEAEQQDGDFGLSVLDGQDQGMDNVLEALYDGERSGGLGSSAPMSVAGSAISAPTFQRQPYALCSRTLCNV